MSSSGVAASAATQVAAEAATPAIGSARLITHSLINFCKRFQPAYPDEKAVWLISAGLSAP